MDAILENLPALIKKAETHITGGSAKKRFVMSALQLILKDEFEKFERSASDMIDLLVQIANDPSVLAFEDKCKETCNCFKRKTN